MGASQSQEEPQTRRVVLENEDGNCKVRSINVPTSTLEEHDSSAANVTISEELLITMLKDESLKGRLAAHQEKQAVKDEELGWESYQDMEEVLDMQEAMSPQFVGPLTTDVLPLPFILQPPLMTGLPVPTSEPSIEPIVEPSTIIEDFTHSVAAVEEAEEFEIAEPVVDEGIEEQPIQEELSVIEPELPVLAEIVSEPQPEVVQEVVEPVDIEEVAPEPILEEEAVLTEEDVLGAIWTIEPEIVIEAFAALQEVVLEPEVDALEEEAEPEPTIVEPVAEPEPIISEVEPPEELVAEPTPTAESGLFQKVMEMFTPAVEEEPVIAEPVVVEEVVLEVVEEMIVVEEVVVEPVVEEAVTEAWQEEPVPAAWLIKELEAPAAAPAAAPVAAPVAVVDPTTKLADSLFSHYKAQEVEKVIVDAKLEGAKSQAMLDADIMSGILSNERSRWRGKFAVVEDRMQKRKADISTAHETAVAMVTDSLNIPEPEDPACSSSVSSIIECYAANPGKTLRCKELTESFSECAAKSLRTR